MILLLAPAPNLSFGAMPSGSTYVSDQYGLVKVVNDSGADQAGLEAAGCYTLTPFGAWGTLGFQTLTELYAADTGAILPGITGFPRHVIAQVFDDGDDTGGWVKTGTGNGSGNWTKASAYTSLALPAAITAAAEEQVALAEAAAALAGHYANDDTDTDVPGGSPGDRGAKFYADAAGADATATGEDRTAAEGAAALAGHYANDDTDTDVPGGSPGDRGAKFYADAAGADAVLTAADRVQTGIDASVAAAGVVTITGATARLPIDFNPVTIGGQTVIPAIVTFGLQMALGVIRQSGRLWFVDSAKVYAAADKLGGALDWEATNNVIPIVQDRAGGSVSVYDKRADAIFFAKPVYAAQAQTYLARTAGPFAFAQRNNVTGSGQSLMSGDEIPGIVSDTAPYSGKLYTFAAGPKPEGELTNNVTADSASPTLFTGKSDLLENTEKTAATVDFGGETPLTGGGAGLLDHLIMGGHYDLASLPEIFMSTAAVGGNRMSYLLSTGGFNRWSGRYINQIASAKAIAVTDGVTFKHLATLWCHGQADVELALSGSQDYATYLAGLTKYHDDTTAYVQGAPISQTETPLFIMTQPCHKSAQKTGNTGDIVCRAMYDFQDSQTRFIACPDYWALFRELNYTHPLPVYQRLIGAYFAKVLYIAGYLGLQWTGMRPRGIWTRGKYVFINHYVPFGTAAIDFSQFGRITDCGYKVTDGGGTKTIVDVWPQSADTIGIECSTAVSGTTRVRYALDYARTTGRFLPNTGSGAGNIRDTDPAYIDIDGVRYRLPNWCQAYDLPANVLLAEV